MSDFPREIMTRCLKNDAYLKTRGCRLGFPQAFISPVIQKALVFDEDDKDSFENTYNDNGRPADMRKPHVSRPHVG